MTASNLWNAFQKAFFGSLAKVSDDRLWKAWHIPSERTKFYTAELLQEVTKDLGLKVRKEWFTVDFALWSTGSDNLQIPSIFVESENNPFSASHEIAKLCCLAAPLRVLVTVADWEDALPRWPKGSRTKLVTEWCKIREVYTQAWPDSGVVGVIVGEWGPGDILRFHVFELPTAGSPFLGEHVAFERHVTAASL